MQRSFLIQRLTAPSRVANPFSFGGGLHNGGLSADAMSLLSQIFSFDYMGAAEFEWGAVPEALQGMAKDAEQLIAYLHQDLPVSVICRSSAADEVDRRIFDWATTEFVEGVKEQPRLFAALTPRNEYDSRYKGWLELSNGFFFFTDRDMWAKTAVLFGLEVLGTPAEADKPVRQEEEDTP